MEARLEDRRKAMVEMPEMIRLWKQVSITRVLLIVERVLTIRYREVMVVAGNSGPSGKQGDATECSLRRAFVFFCSFETTYSAFKTATFAGAPFGCHLYEFIAGVRDWSFLDFAPFHITCIILHKDWALSPRLSEQPEQSCHCA